MPLAKKALDYFRAQAKQHDWTPEPEDVIYRVGVHCAASDDLALQKLEEATREKPKTSLTMSNRALEGAIASTGYYGRDIDSQRARLMPADLKTRIEKGQILLGSPDTIVRQLENIKRELDCGVIDFTVAHQMRRPTAP